jgi:uncharacterized delta-60 repeat protein
VRSIVVQTNGQAIIVGDFTAYNGTNQGSIARINSDGSLDTTFNSGTGITQGFPTQVETVALQSDGKILFGGRFDVYNGKSAEGVARLNSDGSLDTNFVTANLVGGGIHVYSVVPQPDGKVIMGGEFVVVHSIGRNYIARLNTDGSLDTSFNPGFGTLAPLFPYVYSVLLQPDGEIIIGGGFTSVNRQARWYVARLHGDAPQFSPGGVSNGNFLLQWTAITGRTYRVQFTSNLISGNWSNLVPDILAVSNTASMTDPLTNPQRFYRVSLLP